MAAQRGAMDPRHWHADQRNCCSLQRLASDRRFRDTRPSPGASKQKLSRRITAIPPRNHAFGATNWNIPVWPLMVVCN